jgi:penicillin-binding protein 1A
MQFPRFRLPTGFLSRRTLLIAGAAVLGAGALCLALVGVFIVLAWPQLPELSAIKDYRPKIPLRVYSADGHLIGEFGEERRDIVRIRDVPVQVKNAILAIEDARFYDHAGIDWVGVLRAGLTNLRGGMRQGASTITMQVARNFYLSTERTLARKLYEALLAIKIENNLSKDEILEVYVNQIYLGQRAYGFAAAARVYFGKALEDISLAQAAMLAGLPKAPSACNPIVNFKCASQRQAVVLSRMKLLGLINDTQAAQAQAEPIQVDTIGRPVKAVEGHAAYVAEMARQIAVDRFKESAYTQGLRVMTTVLFDQQEAAYQGLRKTVMDYDRRHGYRGAKAFVDMNGVHDNDDQALADLLDDIPDSDDLTAAIVLEAEPKKLRAWLRNGEQLVLTGEALQFAAPMLKHKAPSAQRLRRGAVIYLQKVTKTIKPRPEALAIQDKGSPPPTPKTEISWQISQLPEVEAAFVAINPGDGAVRALVGGFDFAQSSFNHVTQAWRQPGSSFKPFIYSAALEKGYGPGAIIKDEPLVLPGAQTGAQSWAPKNYDGSYDGPISMRDALTRSKNMVSIRILQAIGAEYAQDYVARFGFDADKHPPYLTMALGAGSVTPWQQARAYAVFANGGYLIEPYLVNQILGAQGEVLAAAKPVVAGDESLRVIDPRNAWIMDSMMRDVTLRGTAARADKVLGRRDLAGKTGTTNDYVDAWFCGYQHSVVGVAWMGFDQPKRLGSGETGGTAALPMWIAYMNSALNKVPEFFQPQPEGIALASLFGPDGQPTRKDFLYAENIPAGGPVPSETPLPDDLLPPHPLEGVGAAPIPITPPGQPSPAPPPVVPASPPAAPPPQTPTTGTPPGVKGNDWQ